MHNNSPDLPEIIQKLKERVRLYIHPEKQCWCIDDELGTHEVFHVIGEYCWSIETETYKVVYEKNFHPYTVEVANHRIRAITDRNGNQLDEYWIYPGPASANHFWKTRMLEDNSIDRVQVCTPWDRQLYGSEEGRLGAQEKYTMGW